MVAKVKKIDMKITVIGHSYVGLVTACVFADFGNEVDVIGHTKEKIEKLKNGDPIIFEPGLAELLKKNLSAKRIKFYLDDYQLVKESDVVLITVGTPPKENGEPNLSSVIEVAKKISENLSTKDNHFTVVACKSTVPVGTNRLIEKIIKTNNKKNNFAVASCPEFLREGTAIYDTLNADRIVIGSDSKKAIEILLKLHQPLNGERVVTNLATAELIKYVSNAILGTKISFANLIAFYSEKVGADVEAVLDAVGLDKRIGRIFMNPGLGYGGSCLPKDISALIDMGKKLNINTNLLQAVEEINFLTKKNFLDKILKNSPGKKIAIWGLSFKPNTDDIRFAPSIFLIENLLENKYQITVYDPVAMNNIKKVFRDKISYKTDPYLTVKNKDALIIATEWNDFKQIDLLKIKSLLRQPYIFDGRNLYHPSLMKKIGFKYFSVGRPSIL